jgi:hypothetical protein
LKGNDEPTMSLAVQASFVPTKEQYRSLLEEAMEELISSSPTRARQTVEQLCDPRINPDLCNIQAASPTQEWAVQISQCDQMGMLLGRINWQKENPPQKLSDENLPSLMEILQML